MEKRKKRWFFEFCGVVFHGFSWVWEGEEPDCYPTGGPFDSFAEAKKEALKRCRVDLRMLNKSIVEIQGATARAVPRETNDDRA